MRTERERGPSHSEKREQRPGTTVDEFRAGFRSRLRLTVLKTMVWALKKLSEKHGSKESSPPPQQEILDRLDAILSYLPKHLREMLTGSREAGELFTLLEGKTVRDVQGIEGAVDTFAQREHVRASDKRINRNAPCPCGATHPDGRPIKFKHCCGRNNP